MMQYCSNKIVKFYKVYLLKEVCFILLVSEFCEFILSRNISSSNPKYLLLL